jgi:ABC-2 type transport system permease protein
LSNALLIMRRELAAYLRSPMGYVIAAAVLCIDGLMFQAFALTGKPRLSADVIRDFFYFSSGTTMIAAVLLSMRLLAEERQVGTIVLLNTAPIRHSEVVAGKFLSAFVFLAALTLATLYQPLLVMVNGKISGGHIAIGYAGLLLLGAASLAIGLFASSLARTQVLAAVVGAAILVAMLVMWLAARVMDPPLRDVAAALALHSRHFEPFMKGVLHARDIVFYVAVTYAFLLASTKVLEARRWE